MGQVLDIAPLRSLVAVADCGGFHRAAAVLHMTQSAVSQHVRRIEAVVGGPVVERSGRGVAFTELGHRVLGHARGILAAHDAALTDLGAAEEQVLLIGATEHGADVMLPALTAALGERLPNWRLRFRLDRNVTLADALEHGLVDLAVMLDGSGLDPAHASGTLALKWVSGRALRHRCEPAVAGGDVLRTLHIARTHVRHARPVRDRLPHRRRIREPRPACSQRCVPAWASRCCR